MAQGRKKFISHQLPASNSLCAMEIRGRFFSNREVGKWMSQNGWSLCYLLGLVYDSHSSREHKTIEFSPSRAIGGCDFQHPFPWEDLSGHNFSKSWHGSNRNCKQTMINYLWELFLLQRMLLEGNICLLAGSCWNSVRAKGLERLIFILSFLLCNSLTSGETALGLGNMLVALLIQWYA